jgi:hypothetical protein
VRKAISMVSRVSVIASGVLGGGVGGSSCESGIGLSQTTSSSFPAAPSSAATLAASTARRSSRAIASRQAFVATRYSQGRSGAPSFRLSRYRQARSIVSCTASSASGREPSMR